jgi:hypothetical protein
LRGLKKLDKASAEPRNSRVVLAQVKTMHVNLQAANPQTGQRS